MTGNEIARVVVDAAFEVHTRIVQLKSVEHTAPVHQKQVLTCIRLADKRLGRLIDFGAPLIKDGLTRPVDGLRE